MKWASFIEIGHEIFATDVLSQAPDKHCLISRFATEIES